VTFASGSRLAVIEMEAFDNCTQLTSFHIPSAMERIDGSAFQSTRIPAVTFDAANRHFRACGPFLLDFEAVSVIRHFGSTHEVRIPKRIQRLSRSCFQKCRSLHRVIFEANTELLAIEENAFHLSSLESISIPKSVVSLESKCFSGCRELLVIDFEYESKLRDVASDILDESFSVARVDIPEVIMDVCKRGFRREFQRGMVTIKTRLSQRRHLRQ
jgi:hypothetical protein